ncbi:hypothetical protein HD806DRAFT_551279 [Xylariaceae sp. AK1471]|nr:hypothetical protein HD806DRAFT_551279 [Xylariaceae sp. AK1471]
MASIQDSSWLRPIVAVHAADECAPSVWQPGQFEKRAPLITGSSVSTITSSRAGSDSQSSSSFAAIATTTPGVSVSPLVSAGDVAPGEVNCRYTTTTADVDINYYTCTALATKYGISVNTFFMLNPTVKPDCSNIQADTDYCVSGFVEPIRASGGLCGPPNKNATCLGTALQCCNANTFTCGNSTQSGLCSRNLLRRCLPGDSIFTTDGKCGAQHGYKQCAGIWGDCCNADGQCGTGPDFCGYGNCQLGNCTVPVTPRARRGPNSLTCNVVYGNCYNKDGMCGALQSDCGAGCQPQYGNCSSPTTTQHSSTATKSTSSTTTRTSTTSSTTLSSTTSKTTTPTTTMAPNTSLPSFTDLPQCGQTCFNNLQAQYSAGCSSPSDAYCLCNNVNFGYGIRDCANGACSTAVGSAVIAYGSSYCAQATATHTATVTGIAALPSCGQTCFANLQAQYSALGCTSPDPYCLCNNVNFGYGIRDCANGACGAAVGSTVIAYGSTYCAQATATHTGR